MGWYYGFKPYVPVAQRRAEAAREIAKRTKKGQSVCPVCIEGRAITSTFWGQAWCQNLESYSDFANRLPRGRTYVRNGSVVDLKIDKGRITALVSGSSLYEIEIDIAALPKQHWQTLKQHCSGQIGSLVELLQGKLSKSVMELVTDRHRGLFPKPGEIEMNCSCPDWAGMCKHIAAVMYGVGNRLDRSPELLFLLRAVDHAELIEQAIPKAPAGSKGKSRTIATGDLGAIFDIEIENEPGADGGTFRKDPPTKPTPKKPRTPKNKSAGVAPTRKPKKAPAKKKAVSAPRKG
jgi:uncharacterized Zn finger protein